MSDRVLPALTEAALISRYFAGTLARPDVRIGIGDDAAVTALPAGKALALATVTLPGKAAGRGAESARALGRAVLAGALDRLTAAGAEPAWFTLALTLPEADPRWLEAFSAGLLGLAAGHDVQLVGGDTTRGPLAVTVTCLGLLTEDSLGQR